MKKQKALNFKLSKHKDALFATAFSVFLLSTVIRNKPIDSSFEDERVYATYSDGRDDDEGDVVYSDSWDDEEAYVAYSDDDNLYYGHHLADASSTRRNSSGKRAQDAACHSPFHRMHFGVRHTEARGVGYHDGYTTLEGFGIYDHNPYFMPFLDLRGHVFNNGKLAGNVGIGERTVLSSINHIIGAYLYYDVRQENHSFTINQLSPGFELLGKRMEYRINGYFPVGRSHSDKYGYEFNRFHNNNILLHNKQKFAMKGGDAEVGAHITQSTKYDLYAGAGPYYFSASHSHAWGGKVRLLGRYKEYVSLEASYSYDRLFRNVVQGTVAFNYPFGAKLKRKDQNCPQQNDLMLSRAAFAPYRFEIPVVKKKTQTSKAIDPATGKPWQVWFVNNTSSSAGTYQSPFPTLLLAQNASSPNDMIYVFPGDGTTTGMDMGITLQDGQKLFGSSVAHKIKTSKGKMVIPTFSSNAPTITISSFANVIVLGNGNEISGMNLLVTKPASGIFGSNINGVTIDRNVISGSVGYFGMSVTSMGKVNITNNQITSSLNQRGITLNFINGQLTKGNISNNIISGFTVGISCGPGNANNTGIGEILISNNTISNYISSGILLPNGIPNGTSQIINNTLFDTKSVFVGINDAGINIVAATNLPNAGTHLIKNNQIISTNVNSVTGVQVTSNRPVPLQAFITNNSIQVSSGAGSIGLDISNVSGSTFCTSVTGNQFALQAPTGTNAMSIATTGTGVINVEKFSQVQVPGLLVSGNVNIVPPGTCSQ